MNTRRGKFLFWIVCLFVCAGNLYAVPTLYKPTDIIDSGPGLSFGYAQDLDLCYCASIFHHQVSYCYLPDPADILLIPQDNGRSNPKMPSVPGSFSMVLLGFLLISIVRDKCFWIAAVKISALATRAFIVFFPLIITRTLRVYLYENIENKNLHSIIKGFAKISPFIHIEILFIGLLRRIALGNHLKSVISEGETLSLTLLHLIDSTIVAHVTSYISVQQPAVPSTAGFYSTRGSRNGLPESFLGGFSEKSAQAPFFLTEQPQVLININRLVTYMEKNNQ